MTVLWDAPNLLIASIPSLSIIISIFALLITTSNYDTIQTLIYSRRMTGYGMVFFAVIISIWSSSEFFHGTQTYLWLQVISQILIISLGIYGLVWLSKGINFKNITFNREFREIITALTIFWLFSVELNRYVDVEMIQTVNSIFKPLVLISGISLLIFTIGYLKELFKGVIVIPIDVVPLFLGAMISFVMLGFSMLNFFIENHFSHYLFELGAMVVFLYCEMLYSLRLYRIVK
jgi:hypothetical protein